MTDHTISMRDVRLLCGVSDHAIRTLFRDVALQHYATRHGPNGGRPRRYWRLSSLAPILRQQAWFTPEMEKALAQYDLQQRTQGND